MTVNGEGFNLLYDTFFDLTFEKIFQQIIEPNLENISIDTLKNIKIKLVSKNIGTKYWNLYDCLYTEIKDAETRNLLVEGKWYEINIKLINRINEQFKPLLENSSLNNITFLPFNKKLVDIKVKNKEALYPEDAYNKMLWEKNKNNLYLLDRKTIQLAIEGRQIIIECCDLLSSNLQFLHVKQNSGEAALCHLFYQGWKSAKYLAQITDEYVKKLEKILKKEENVNSENKINELINDISTSSKMKEIVFCIIDKSKRDAKNKLNFTAKWYLCNIAKNLKSFNYKLIVNFIKFETYKPK